MFVQKAPPTEPERLAAIAKTVTIHRDRYGVPHIEGPTDASVAFGLMVAQAEDNFPQLEEDTAYALGRAAELIGERGVANDLRVAAFQTPARAEARLERADARFKALAQGYADGLNYFLLTHPSVKPRAMARFDPWNFMAMVDLPAMVDGVSTLRLSGGSGPAPEAGFPDAGSNAWALAPSRTGSKHATLFLNPHVGLFGHDQRYECHLHSGQGWEFSGFCVLGAPIPHAGHNAHLGWSHTNTRADGADAYLEDFSDPTDPLKYRYGKTWKKAVSWEETITVKTDTGYEPRKFRIRQTVHGPIFGERDGKPVAVRLPLDRMDDYWPQKYAMTRARNLGEFQKALNGHSLTYSNTTYADDEGHIAFWYGDCVPRRDPSFDWKRPVPGWDPNTDWKGYLNVEELPHVIDPKAGFVQNSNSDPWHTSASDNPQPADFPAYIVNDPDTARAKNARRILTSQATFNYEELERLAFDTQTETGPQRVPVIVGAVEADAERAKKLAEPLAILKAWNGLSAVDSIAATLYFETELAAGGEARPRLTDDPATLAAAFESTVARLEKDWGTWRVAWGEVNRAQRPKDALGRPVFSDDAPSLPVPGAPSAFGQVFAFAAPRPGGLKRRYGTGGNTYVALVEFGPTIRAMSVCGYGQSAAPASPHFFDQAPLYAKGEFKPAWFAWPDVLANAERTYHPGG